MKLSQPALKHLLILTAVLISAALPLRADTFGFNFSTTGLSATGVFTATQSSTIPNAFNITGVTGQVNGIPITALVPGSYDPNNLTTINLPNFYFSFDNLLYTSGPTFDIGGVLMQLGKSLYVNLYNDPVLGLTYLDNTNTRLGGGAATIAPVPEPATLALFGTGALSLVGVLRRRLRP